MTDIDELRSTVRRMEARLASDDRQPVGDRQSIEKLLECYATIKARFEHDLANERDVLLSCGGALMLLQEFAARLGRQS